jgi:hypothetical protein
VRAASESTGSASSASGTRGHARAFHILRRATTGKHTGIGAYATNRSDHSPASSFG